MNESTESIAAVAERAEGLLRESPYQALKHVGCECREGRLTLRGRLPSYYLRQVAVALVCRVAGVEGVEDRIEVVAPSRSEPEG